ncbi:MAG: hypothetical protein ACMVO5_09330 [Polymorphobacter sp.]|uniref:hypothetical protein n=1 Tax=Polymorphobacter sp. TaxID=1909290 RepID=UPI003A88ED5C
MKQLTKTLIGIFALGGIGIAAALAQPQPRPDTEFCAKMRARDPGGICSPKGEYVTASKVYLPNGQIVDRKTGN